MDRCAVWPPEVVMVLVSWYICPCEQADSFTVAVVVVFVAPAVVAVGVTAQVLVEIVSVSSQSDQSCVKDRVSAGSISLIRPSEL